MMIEAAEVRSIFAGVLLAAVAGATTLCTPASAQDLRAYCARVGNDDRVQPMPGNLIPNARRMFELAAETPDSYVQASTSVRCANGAVWLCSYGANLVCVKKPTSAEVRTGRNGFAGKTRIRRTFR